MGFLQGFLYEYHKGEFKGSIRFKGPCTQRVYTLAFKYSLYRYFGAKVYTVWVHGPIGNWNRMGLGFRDSVVLHSLKRAPVRVLEGMAL